MAESDEDDVLFSTSRSGQQTRGLLGNGVKNIDDIMNGPKEDRRLKKTLALCAAFLGAGLAIAVLGPTLTSLKEQLAVTYPKISYVFVGRSVGYLAGSVVGGVMFEWFHPSLLMAVALLASGIGLIAAPFCSALWSLATLLSMVGLAMGALDTGANVVCLRLWGKRSSPFLQALHFCFAVGAFLAPLLAAPFIATAASTTAYAPASNTTLAPFSTQLLLTANSTELNQTGTKIPDGMKDAGQNMATPNKTSTEPPSTEHPTTKPPSIEPPTTEPPTTEHPTTEPPTAEPPTTEPPTTEPPAAEPPAAEPLTTEPSTLKPPTSKTPTPKPPTSKPPTSKTPTPKQRKRRESEKTELESTTEPELETEPESNGEPAPGDGGTETQFRNVYIIIGVVNMLVSGSFFYFFCTSPVKPPPPPTSGQANDGQTKNKDFKVTVLVLMFFFYFLYVGAEVSFGGYIFTFAMQSSLGFDEAAASLLNAAFWGAFATGRGLSICLASVVSPLVMLILDMVGCLLSSAVLSWYGDTSGTVLWIGTMVLGLSMASLFPAGISWLESYYKVTGSMATILVVGSALGEMVFPVLIGQMLGQPDNSGFLQIGPIGLMYFMLATSGLTGIIFAVMQYLAMQHGVKQTSPGMSNPAQDIKEGVHEAIDMKDLFPKGNAKQTTKIMVPKPLRAKKHNE